MNEATQQTEPTAAKSKLSRGLILTLAVLLIIGLIGYVLAWPSLDLKLKVQSFRADTSKIYYDSGQSKANELGNHRLLIGHAKPSPAGITGISFLCLTPASWGWNSHERFLQGRIATGVKSIEVLPQKTPGECLIKITAEHKVGRGFLRKTQTEVQRIKMVVKNGQMTTFELLKKTAENTPTNR